jgi:Protein of unknown function (DUF998)
MTEARTRSAASTQNLLRCGIVAGPLFICTFLVEGARRPDYDPLRHPVSSLALGPGGWVQVANFAVAGTLYLAEAVGLRRAHDPTMLVEPVLIGAAAVGLIVSGAFRTDPVGGYPPGTPDVPATTTRTGQLHVAGAVPVFLGLPVTQLVDAWRCLRGGSRGWAAYSVVSSASMLGNFGAASAGFAQVPRFAPYGGLFQRATVVSGLGWLTAISARALSRGR